MKTSGASVQILGGNDLTLNCGSYFFHTEVQIKLFTFLGRHRLHLITHNAYSVVKAYDFFVLHPVTIRTMCTSQ
uniref:Uncharacterized protein n=1 Tax=Arundo donax TaxID=35708 RepID=A0A0A9HLW3_ARUDO